MSNFLNERQEDGRPTFTSYYLQLAVTAALRGDCRRSQVGAVLVLSDGRTAFFGYNGVLSGQPGCLEGKCPRGMLTYTERPSDSDYSDCISQHAEANVLRTAANNSGTLRLMDSKLYVTRQPCRDCTMTAFFTYGVQELWWPLGHLSYFDYNPEATSS